ncbi:hypothetical protein UMZ34_25720 [Halopseudomonas pachastrellae]|nr:hypothetical protein UMZ34_25720 [Halopseudomonas pachastrellae]
MLYPYIRQAYLNQTFDSATDQDLADFVRDHSTLPFASRLKDRWLTRWRAKANGSNLTSSTRGRPQRQPGLPPRMHQWTAVIVRCHAAGPDTLDCRSLPA